MEHFYITGDTHRNQYKWVEQIEPILSPADKILVCGDFGVGLRSSSGRHTRCGSCWELLGPLYSRKPCNIRLAVVSYMVCHTFRKHPVLRSPCLEKIVY